MKKLTVVLADDHALVRAGIRALLDQLEGITVVGEAGDGVKALEVIAATQPDVALVDLAMPALGGIAVVERVRTAFPTVRIIILSMHRGAEFVTQAMRAGAAGFLVKDAAANELELAITAVAQGGTYLSPAVTLPLVTASAGTNSETHAGPDEPTPRQREVLRFVAEGKTTKEIAHELGISAKTVEVHRAQLMERLGIHDVPGLVRYAMRTGLIAPEPYNGL